MTYFILLFLQLMIQDTGYIIYNSSTAFFVSDKHNKAFKITSWDESNTAINQYIEVEYLLNKDNEIENLKVSESFAKISHKSNRLMEIAETHLNKREFKFAKQYLDSILLINDKFPYLLHSYLYLYTQTKDESQISNLNNYFNKNLRYYQKKEISDYFYELHIFYKQLYFSSKELKKLKTSQQMFLKSLSFWTSNDRQKELRELEELLEKKSNG